MQQEVFVPTLEKVGTAAVPSACPSATRRAEPAFPVACLILLFPEPALMGFFAASQVQELGNWDFSPKLALLCSA